MLQSEMQALVSTLFAGRTDGMYYCVASDTDKCEAYVQFRTAKILNRADFMWWTAMPTVMAGNVTQLVRLNKNAVTLSNIDEGPEGASLPATDINRVRMSYLANLKELCTVCGRAHASPCAVCFQPACEQIPAVFCEGCGATACSKCRLLSHVCNNEMATETNIYCRSSSQLQPEHVCTVFKHVDSTVPLVCCGHLGGYTAQAAVRHARKLLIVPGNYITFHNERTDEHGAVARGIDKTISKMPSVEQATRMSSQTQALWQTLRQVFTLQKCLQPYVMLQLELRGPKRSYLAELRVDDIAFVRSVVHLYTADVITIDLHGFLTHLCIILPMGAATIMLKHTRPANVQTLVAQTAASVLHTFATFDPRNARSFFIAELIWSIVL